MTLAARCDRLCRDAMRSHRTRSLQAVAGRTQSHRPALVQVSSKGCMQAADVWSCGVMLYILLAAAYPFSRPEDEQQLPAARMRAVLQVRIMLSGWRSAVVR